jgi:multidrug efflux pump subunit AcrA (membrane-fusion protein)
MSDVALVEAAFKVAITLEKVNVSKAVLELAEVALEEYTITAPFHGAITALYANKGEWMEMGDPFLELVSLQELELTIDIPPKFASGLRLGLTTDVLIEGQIVGTAKAKTIFPVIDPASGLRRIIWLVIPLKGLLLSGQYVSLTNWKQ